MNASVTSASTLFCMRDVQQHHVADDDDDEDDMPI